MPEFQLFRLKVYPSTQGSLFETPKTASAILRDIILSQPSAEFRTGVVQHIGNVANIDRNALYFRIGRTSESTIEVYENNNFAEEQFETAPYTHVFLDTRLEICAIAKKPRLSRTTTGIARQFIRLLAESERNRQIRASFEIDPINDPEDFITQLREAIVISKFWVTFSKPNPFDTNRDFTQPMEKLLREADGQKGRTELQGQNLKPDVLEELARSAASTGEDAAAWIQSETDDKPVKKQLDGNPVVVEEENVQDIDDKKDFIERMRHLYEKIRGKVTT